MNSYLTAGRSARGSVFRTSKHLVNTIFTMFSSKLAFCWIFALHFPSFRASSVQETNAVQSADLEPYAATERGARALYITLSTQASSSYVSGDVLYITISGSSITNSVTVSDSPTQGASYVAPNGRLDITITGSSSQTRINYDGTPYQPAIDYLSIKISGSNNQNNINVAGSSITASGSLRISFDGSTNVNSVTINDPSLGPADRRLQISSDGSNNENTVTVNSSPRVALQSADLEPAAADAFLSIIITGSNTRNNINIRSTITASGSLRISIDGSTNVNSVTINDPSLRPADTRLQITLTGSNNDNQVIVNGSPRQIL